MALQPTRMEFRVTLSHVDAGRELADQAVYVARHPSETMQHVTLRVLAWCLLNDDSLEFGPGLSAPDAADLWAHDPSGRLTTWIECGAVPAERLRKTMTQHSGAQAHVVLDDEKAARELVDQLVESRWPRACPPAKVWLIDHDFVVGLAANEERRQRWSVTIVGDHFYVDVAGRTLNGAITAYTCAS